MKRFKKYVASVVAMMMCASMAACGGAAPDEHPLDGDGYDNTQSTTEVGDSTSTDSSGTDAVEVASSSLKGTGPATKEDAFNSEGGNDSAQLKDGDVLVDINFDDNDVDGFMSYTNGGTFDLKNEDGQLVATIKNCGGLDYANQIYWDGFGLSEHCVYTYSFDISCDIERKVEYRLQINGGDYHAYQGEKIDVGPDVTNFSVDFEMTEESDPAPRIVFNMGKMEDMSSDPGEHKITIDNIKLQVKDASNAIEVSALPTYVNVAVNQMGYKPDDKKFAVVKTDTTGDEEFIVCDASTNETVYAGKLGDPIHDYGADIETRQADFSALTEEGEYYVYTEEGASYTFGIYDNPYTDIYRDTVLMLYRQRCGIALENNGVFDHPECHTSEAVIYGDESGKKVDVSGGWHDAGDYGRYTVSTAKTIADLLNSYQDFGVEDDNLGIPESGNGIPDLLDEARVGLDWMLKMQDPETGGVYHKVTCAVFPETVAPEEETDELILAPISVTATADFAACLAKASVMYKDIDADFSAEALAAAEKAWDYISGLESFKGFKNPKEIVTGEYPDDKTLDERYWAAVELYLAGYEDTKDFITKTDANDINENLGWADVGLYANYDLALSDDAELASKGKEQIVTFADELVAQSKKTGYFLGFGSNFFWGSNMNVANQGEILYMAQKVTGDATYGELAKHQLDYLLGTNAMGYCFVTGYGTFSPENPHHRPSQVAGQAVSGMLVGGPNKNLEDPYAIAVLTEESPATSYVDNVQSYSTNEVAIYWNSPLIYLLAAEQ